MESTFSHRTLMRPGAACAVALVGLTSLAVFQTSALDGFDRALGREPQDLTEDNNSAASVWLWIADVSRPVHLLYVAALGALVLAVFGRRREAVIVAVAVFAAEFASRGLKQLVGSNVRTGTNLSRC